MEFAAGPNLFEAILQRPNGHFSEAAAIPVVHQIASALHYLHNQGVVHRDIKPENINILAPDPTGPDPATPRVKLLDFGLSKFIDEETGGSKAKTMVGTPIYLAPEVELLSRRRRNRSGKAQNPGTDTPSPGSSGNATDAMSDASSTFGSAGTAQEGGQYTEPQEEQNNEEGEEEENYGFKADCWSLGVVVHVMLVARYPEFDRSSGKMVVKLDTGAWANASPEAKDLVRHLMDPDHQTRFSSEAALTHPWLRSAAKSAPPSPIVRAHLPGFDPNANLVNHSLVSTLSPATSAASSMSTIDLDATAQHGTDNMNGTAHRPEMGDGSTAQKKPRASPAGLSSGTAVGVAGEGGAEAQNIPVAMCARDQSSPWTQGEVEGRKRAGSFERQWCPVYLVQRRIFDLFQLGAAMDAPPEMRAELVKSAHMAREGALERVGTIRKLKTLTEEVHNGIEDLVLAAEVQEPRLAHDILQQQQEWVESLRFDMRKICEMNEILSKTVQQILTDQDQDNLPASPKYSRKDGFGVQALRPDLSFEDGTEDLRSSFPPRTPPSSCIVGTIISNVTTAQRATAGSGEPGEEGGTVVVRRRSTTLPVTRVERRSSASVDINRLRDLLIEVGASQALSSPYSHVPRSRITSLRCLMAYLIRSCWGAGRLTPSGGRGAPQDGSAAAAIRSRL